MKKQYRVKQSQEIELILKENKKVYNPYFSLYKKQNPETSHFRYAISVGKKIGNAVVRNRVKRQVTAIIDSLKLNLDSNTDVFVIVRPRVLELEFKDMEKQLEYLFKKHKIL